MKPQLAAEIVEAGHEVAVHGWDHRYLPLRGPLATYDDLARTTDTITSATGVVPRLFRPPYGVLSTSALVAARRLGLRPVLWSCWGREWAPGATPQSVFGTLKQDLRGGATVLLHDSDCTSPAGSAMAALGAPCHCCSIEPLPRSRNCASANLANTACLAHRNKIYLGCEQHVANPRRSPRRRRDAP